MKPALLFIKTLFSRWSDHDAPTLGAAVAFYTVLSLSPLLVLALSVAAIAFDRSVVLQQMTQQVESLVGSGAAQAINAALSGAQSDQKQGIIASILSFVVLLFSASGVFSALHDALNRIFEVKVENAAGVGALIRARIFAFGMVLSVAFLLVASLLLSAALAAIGSFVGGAIPGVKPAAAVVDGLISIAGVSGVFALTFRYVPTTRTPWRQSFYGGLMTSILFALGKYAMGIYLAKAAVGSSYGAAGSVVVIIVWVYYIAQIVFFGAEFTHAIVPPAEALNS